MTTIRRLVALPAELWRAVRAAAAAEGIPTSEWVRRALEAALDR